MIFLRKGSWYPSFFFATQAVSSQQGARHKPPIFNDNAPGRYASALFIAASKKDGLQAVLEDLHHLREVIETQPSIRQFLKNSAIKKAHQHEVFNTFIQTSYNQLTIKLIDIAIQSGRLADLQNIIEKYISYCKILNKQQDIKIISAKQLNEQQKIQVEEALKKNKPETKFKINYAVDKSILGGLQVYAGAEFLDCSLRSRMKKLKDQLSKM